MTTEELETAKEGAETLDQHDFHTPADDDYFSATLYEAKSGRMFRVIEMSGMNSRFAGAGGIGRWITSGERAHWKTL